MTLTTKEQFLIDHNALSPVNLQATLALLTQFQEAKKPLLKDTDWSVKLRIPFISWLLALPPEKKKYVRTPKIPIYKPYPERI